MGQPNNQSGGGQGDPKVKGKADVLFLIDVTGSMEDCLENLKGNIIELSSRIDEISKRDYGAVGTEIRYNAIGFRDLFEDKKAMVIRDKKFTADLNEIKAFFDTPDMKAAGGGDDPESSLDALYIGLKELEWTQPARVIILFTDQPPKKTLHPSTVGGRSFDEETSLNVVIQELGKARVIIFGPKGVLEYKKIGDTSPNQYIGFEKAEDSLKDFKDRGLFEKHVVERIAKTVSMASTKPWGAKR